MSFCLVAFLRALLAFLFIYSNLQKHLSLSVHAKYLKFRAQGFHDQIRLAGNLLKIFPNP